MLLKIRKRKINAGIKPSAGIKPQNIRLHRKTGRATGCAGKWLSTAIITMITVFVLNIGVSAAHRALLQRGIAEEVLRFHVLANSDSEEDQRVKLLVRDAVLEWLNAGMDDALDSSEQERIGKDAWTEAASDRECGGKDSEFSADHGRKTDSKEGELEFLAARLHEIERIADRILEEQGMSYRAQASVEHCYFPERTYGNCTFPAGWYDALRIRLGAAEGHNWWCVLYPSLCFSDCLHAVVNDGELADLKEVLTVEEYESLLRKPKKWKIAFRWF